MSWASVKKQHFRLAKARAQTLVLTLPSYMSSGERLSLNLITSSLKGQDEHGCREVPFTQIISVVIMSHQSNHADPGLTVF
jgi:hypothetical protein